MWQLDILALNQFDKLKQNGVYIHSNATPLGPFDLVMNRLLKDSKKKILNL